jgi:hypothetical protein
MRRLLLWTLLVCLVLPPAALALGRAPGDGTLVVRNGAGFLRLDANGAAIGRLDGGQLEVISPTIDDCRDLDVWGADRRPVRSRKDGKTICTFTELHDSGTLQPVRFRIVLGEGESMVVRNANGLWLSAVGRGRGLIKGAGGLDGLYSLNGEKLKSLPDDGASFTLAATLS